MKRALCFLTLIACLFFLTSCKGRPNQSAGEKTILVEVAEVKKGDISREIRFTGNIEAFTDVTIFPKITARVEEMRVDMGDSVRQGDVIALLESDDLQAQFNQAKAALEVMRARWAQMEQGAREEEIAQAEDLVQKARANLRDAQNNYQRMKKLFEKGGIAPRQLESAELVYTVAKADLNSALERLRMLRKGATKEDRQALKAQVRQAEANLELARIRLSYTRITAPITGTISRRYADPGDLALPAKPLAAIVQMNPVKVVIQFPEQQIHYMRPGLEASLAVEAYPGRVFIGRIQKVSPTLDPQTRMFSAEIQVDNDEGLLRPGMFATVRFSVDPHTGVLLVPKTAVLYREEYLENPKISQNELCEVNYLFVVKEGRAHMRKVALGHQSDQWVEVCEGIKPGERVVTLGLHQLNDGDRVEIAGSGERQG